MIKLLFTSYKLGPGLQWAVQPRKETGSGRVETAGDFSAIVDPYE